jgi:hypothetical protein
VESEPELPFMSSGTAASLLLIIFTFGISFTFVSLANWATRRD